jgi:hypothetical protein
LVVVIRPLVKWVPGVQQYNIRTLICHERQLEFYRQRQKLTKSFSNNGWLCLPFALNTACYWCCILITRFTIFYSGTEIDPFLSQRNVKVYDLSYFSNALPFIFWYEFNSVHANLQIPKGDVQIYFCNYYHNIFYTVCL